MSLIIENKDEMKKFCNSLKSRYHFTPKRIQTWVGYWKCARCLTDGLQAEFGLTESESFAFVHDHLKNHYKKMKKVEEIKNSYPYMMGMIKDTASECHGRKTL